MEQKNFKKKKKLSRPTALIVFGIFFLLLPFINYFMISRELIIPVTYPVNIFKSLSIPMIMLLIFPFIVGIGLLRVKKWGWWLFFVYSILLISYDIITISRSFNYFNIGALIRTVIGSIIFVYFVRKDISAPYMKMYPRGWRLQTRKPVIMDIIVGDKATKTRDLSVTGAYVDWPDSNIRLNEPINVSFSIDNQAINLKAGIVRIDGNGVGIAFRDVDKESEKFLERIL